MERLRALRQTPEFRNKIRESMLRPEVREKLSARAVKQWLHQEYKRYMMEKWQAFYRSHPDYQEANRETLNAAQKEYWKKVENREGQAKRTRTYFEKHPELRSERSQKAVTQWKDEALRMWRAQKTREQWTTEFRAKRKEAYNQTYLRTTLSILHDMYKGLDEIDIAHYDEIRKLLGNRCMIRIETICKRFFGGDKKRLEDAVANYNHRVIAVVPLQERRDVYDLEVPETHNFALAPGVFVHNSAKQGRDRETQAILPLRGKILNVERARLDKMLVNNEIKSLIIALGTNIGEAFDLNERRYDRIVIMTDADVDGAHIRTLLLTLFYRYFPELIRQGHMYIAKPPLFRVQVGKEFRYAFTDEEKLAFVKELSKGKEVEVEEGEEAGGGGIGEENTTRKGIRVNIQRYKGLGEMNPEQLWETTMDPKTRVMKQVMIADAEKADEMFDILMGADVAPRKRFIQTHAKTVQNLDV
jgi:DNA gyrase subunit B